MSLQSYLFGLKMSTLFAFSAWTGVVLYIDPEASGIFGKVLFFATLCLFVTGFLTIMVTWAQKTFFREEFAASALGSNMRRCFFVSLFGIVMLLLQYKRMFALWNGLLVSVLFLLIELYFSHYHTKAKKGSVTEAHTQAKTTTVSSVSRLRRKGVI